MKKYFLLPLFMCIVSALPAQDESIKTLKGHKADVNSVRYSPDGKYLACCGFDKTLKIWDVNTGNCIKTFPEQSIYVNSVSYSPDGKYLASVSGDIKIKIWDVNTGNCIKTFKGHNNYVESVSYSPDGKYLASVSWDRRIKIWDVNTGNCIKTFSGHNWHVISVSYSPDGKYLASGSRDKTIKLWDVNTGNCIKTFLGHNDLVESVSYSPDGKYLASGSDDKTIKIWDVNTGNCIKTFLGHNDDVNSVSYSPDGKYLASGSNDETIKIWELYSLTKIVILEREEVEKYVNDSILKWQKKDIFETTEEYKIRVTEANRQKLIDELIKKELSELVDNRLKPQIINGEYDADNEVYKLEFNDIINPIYVKIPRAEGEAQRFLSNINNLKFNSIYAITEDQKIAILSGYVVNPLNSKKYNYDSKENITFKQQNIIANFEPVKLNIANEPIIYQKDEEEKEEIVVGKSDVDINIPENKIEKPSAFAVVIGNANYQRTKNVNYAINDAQTIKKYLIDALGYKEGNIFYIENATKSNFETYFGTEKNPQGKLYNNLQPEKSDVFIYYAGHGAPSIKDKKGYFIPVDCDPQYIEQGGYSLDLFYANLAKLPAKSITCIIDACFSGAEIYEDISPIVVTVTNPLLQIKDCVVLSSSAGSQVSSWYNEEQHGLFTYFFLKALKDKDKSDKNKDNKLTYQEIYDYISNNVEGVPYHARKLHNVEQTPTIEGTGKDKIFIEYK